MKQTGKKSQPERSRHMWDEPDIGSGEKTPGQQETEEMIRQIKPLPESGPGDQPRRAPRREGPAPS